MEYNPWILLAESAPIGVKAPGRTARCDHDDMFLVRAAAMGRGVGSLAYLFLGWRRPLNSVARNIVRGRRGRGQLNMNPNCGRGPSRESMGSMPDVIGTREREICN